jgi:hypothetical protein
MGKEIKHDEWVIEHVKDEERELKKMEKDLEKHMKKVVEEAESWSSDGVNEKHTTIHQAPLHAHAGHHAMGKSSDIGSIFRDLHEMIKGKIGSITKTGPAKEHHKGAILPTHNMFKPGAHPSQKKPDHKHEEHKNAHDINVHKADKTAEELKNRLKPVRIE